MKKSIIKIAGAMAIFAFATTFYTEDSNARITKYMNINAFQENMESESAGGSCGGPKKKDGDNYVCESTNTVSCKDLFGCK